MRGFALCNGLWCTGDEDFTAAAAAFRAEIDNPVRGFNHVQIMFDDHNRVALIAQLMQHVEQLLDVLHQLRDQGNTIVVIEHNLDVIKTADWIVDLGPEGGSGGGEILVSGTPETVAECEASHTARFLKPLL